jgi:hypothetical protein
MSLTKIDGNISVHEKSGDHVARHAGKTASSTSCRQEAMDRCLRKLYRADKFYYRQVSFTWPSGKGPTYIFDIIAETVEEGDRPAQP